MKREVVHTTAVGRGKYVLVGKRPPYENRNYPGVDCRVKTMPRILVRFAVCACILAVSAAAQQSRITEPIDDTARVILPGSVRSKARLSDDQGPADPSLQIPFITLSMKPSAAQQADLARAPYLSGPPKTRLVLPGATRSGSSKIRRSGSPGRISPTL